MGAPVEMAAEALDALTWQAVRSTNVKEIAYVPGSGGPGPLYVRYASGGTYRYDDVERGEHDALLEASRDPEASVGSLLSAVVQRARVQRAREYHRIEIVDP